jgi:hypothetical protein
MCSSWYVETLVLIPLRPEAVCVTIVWRKTRSDAGFGSKEAIPFFRFRDVIGPLVLALFLLVDIFKNVEVQKKGRIRKWIHIGVSKGKI